MTTLRPGARPRQRTQSVRRGDARRRAARALAFDVHAGQLRGVHEPDGPQAARPGAAPASALARPGSRAISGTRCSMRADHVVPQGPQVAAVIELQELRPEGRHVDLDRALADAGLAGEAASPWPPSPRARNPPRRGVGKAVAEAARARCASPASAQAAALRHRVDARSPQAAAATPASAGRGPWASAAARACPSRTGTWRRPGPSCSRRRCRCSAWPRRSRPGRRPGWCGRAGPGSARRRPSAARRRRAWRSCRG